MLSCLVVLAAAGCSKDGPGVSVDDPGRVAGTSSAAPGTPDGAPGEPAPSGSPGAGTGRPATGTGRPPVLVGVRTGKGVRESGALVVLDPVTGTVVRTLDPALVVGGAVQLSPDRATVYYEKAIGCQGQIWAVPVAGGTPRKVVAGSVPALSPDGTRLAYSTRIVADGCSEDGADPAKFHTLAVRSLASGNSRSLPLHPGARVIPAPIGRLSWSADGRHLAVSISSPQDNEAWDLRVVDPELDRYYEGAAGAGTAVPPAGPGSTATPRGRLFFRQGVFLPDGTLFVVHRCCSGGDPVATSELLQVVDPASGAVRRQIAVGLLTKDHTSLDSDASGRWLLYLSGDAVMVSDGGAKPATLATGYQAVDW